MIGLNLTNQEWRDSTNQDSLKMKSLCLSLFCILMMIMGVYCTELSVEHLESGNLDVFDRDFQDSLQLTEKEREYLIKIVSRDDFRISSFSEVVYTVNLVYPAADIENATIAVHFQLKDIKNERSPIYLGSYSALSSEGSCILTPEKLRNYQNSIVVLKVTNNDRTNVGFEVKMISRMIYSLI